MATLFALLFGLLLGIILGTLGTIGVVLNSADLRDFYEKIAYDSRQSFDYEDEDEEL